DGHAVRAATGRIYEGDVGKSGDGRPLGAPRCDTGVHHVRPDEAFQIGAELDRPVRTVFAGGHGRVALVGFSDQGRAEERIHGPRVRLQDQYRVSILVPRTAVGLPEGP